MACDKPTTPDGSGALPCSTDLIKDLERGYQIASDLAVANRSEKVAVTSHDDMAFGFGQALRRAKEFVRRHSENP